MEYLTAIIFIQPPGEIKMIRKYRGILNTESRLQKFEIFINNSFARGEKATINYYNKQTRDFKFQRKINQ
jgi:hypothetical protein